MYSYVFFDLDGTLTQSDIGILECAKRALTHFGVDISDAAKLKKFIGPPLIYVFCNRFGLSKQEGERAVSLYREFYRRGGMLDCRVYDGISTLLDELSLLGIKCVVATCKPHEFATKILRHHGLLDRFAFVSGPEMDGTRGEKHEVIAHALKVLNIADPSTVIMLGDRANDVTGAKQCKIDCIGALWGFGSEEELADAGAVALCKKPEKVVHFFGFDVSTT